MMHALSHLHSYQGTVEGVKRGAVKEEFCVIGRMTTTAAAASSVMVTIQQENDRKGFMLQREWSQHRR